MELCYDGVMLRWSYVTMLMVKKNMMDRGDIDSWR